jgi:hypothetical protein
MSFFISSALKYYQIEGAEYEVNGLRSREN